jgi:hypothetical protein
MADPIDINARFALNDPGMARFAGVQAGRL